MTCFAFMVKVIYLIAPKVISYRRHFRRKLFCSKEKSPFVALAFKPRDFPPDTKKESGLNFRVCSPTSLV